jgi:hypothetical protein
LGVQACASSWRTIFANLSAGAPWSTSLLLKLMLPCGLCFLFFLGVDVCVRGGVSAWCVCVWAHTHIRCRLAWH